DDGGGAARAEPHRGAAHVVQPRLVDVGAIGLVDPLDGEVVERPHALVGQGGRGRGGQGEGGERDGQAKRHGLGTPVSAGGGRSPAALLTSEYQAAVPGGKHAPRPPPPYPDLTWPDRGRAPQAWQQGGCVEPCRLHWPHCFSNGAATWRPSWRWPCRVCWCWP